METASSAIIDVELRRSGRHIVGMVDVRFSIAIVIGNGQVVIGIGTCDVRQPLKSERCA